MSLKELNKNFFSAIIISIVFFATTLPLAGFCRIYQVAEAREGVVVNAMLESGELILPLRHAEIIPSKPPLFHWFGYTLAKLFGEFTPEILRLTSIIFAGMAVYTFFLFCALLANRKFAWIATLLLISSVGFRLLSIDGRVDMVFYFFNTLPLLLWFEAYAKNKSKGLAFKELPTSVYRNTALLTGISVLAKGPLGALVPIMVISLFLLTEVRLKELKSLFSLNWIWVLVVSMPWYVAAMLKGKGAFFDRQIIFENFTRFFGGEGISVKPWWFYFEQYWSFFAPWSVVLVLGVLFLVKEIADKFSFFYVNRDTIIETKQVLIKFSFIWYLVIFFFISLSAGKRSAYLLMVILPFNILLAAIIEMILEKYKNLTEKIAKISPLGRVSYLLTWSILLTLPLYTYSIFPFQWLQEIFKDKPSIILFISSYQVAISKWKIFLFLYASSLSIFSIISFYSFLKKKDFFVFFQSLVTFILFIEIIYLDVFNSVKGVTHSYQDFATEVSEVVPKETKLTFIKRKRDESFDGFFFYMNRTVLLFEPSGDETLEGLPKEEGYYLARSSWIEQQIDKWTRKIEKVKIGGRLVDHDEQKLVLFKLSDKNEEIQASPTNTEALTPLSPQDNPYEDDEESSDLSY